MATYLVMNGALIGNARLQNAPKGGRRKIWAITLYLVEQHYVDKWNAGEAMVDAREFEKQRNRLKNHVRQVLTRKAK